MYAWEAEEKIVFLADAFLSHVPESGAHLPNYRSWLDEQDFTPAYGYLHRMLQFLQWQKRQRFSEGFSWPDRWVLKSPAHLGYLDLLREQFPDLHIVHMHRDPGTTIASGASLNATLHAMHADTVDLRQVGGEWLQRMGWTNDRALAVRESWASEAGLVTDIGYQDAVADPIGQVARVYDAVGVPLTVEAESAMRRWIDERPREAARPAYHLENYGLRPAQIDERFALYNKHFRQYVGK
jgi:Sulfotransferase family